MQITSKEKIIREWDANHGSSSQSKLCPKCGRVAVLPVGELDVCLACDYAVLNVSVGQSKSEDISIDHLAERAVQIYKNWYRDLIVGGFVTRLVCVSKAIFFLLALKLLLWLIFS